jgi:hypothetical protein
MIVAKAHIQANQTNGGGPLMRARGWMGPPGITGRISWTDAQPLRASAPPMISINSFVMAA